MNQDQTMFAEMLGIRKTPPPAIEAPRSTDLTTWGFSSGGGVLRMPSISANIVWS